MEKEKNSILLKNFVEISKNYYKKVFKNKKKFFKK